LALYLSGRCGTPLRALCIAAYDVLHAERYARPLDAATRQSLATLLDLGACVNCLVDSKSSKRHPDPSKEVRTKLKELRANGHGPLACAYLRKLKSFEYNRPAPAGTPDVFSQILRYREDVVRLSLGALATITNVSSDLSAGMRMTQDDDAVNVLFRIVMQCQILDDVLDYRRDQALGLPTCLSAGACEGFPLARTLQALKAYAGTTHQIRSGVMLLWTAVLVAATNAARLTALFGWLYHGR
jgi:hypothetical protein